eukprot:TRINITY_DN1741_c0_g1_i1.p1 TRINITY_DN1741_c0_g1~~TRINITY_DN1741_c0_g1_i1.p1  ORF type:complete len:196 (-),score=35.46 TRINITY_DN1741_c0_g1_i1:120-707(-)
MCGSIFKGIVFCVDTHNKSHSRLEKKITKYGGEVTDHVSKRVDYVISNPTEVKKCISSITSAQKHGVPIINCSFLADSIAEESLQDFEDYLLGSGILKAKEEERPVWYWRADGHWEEYDETTCYKLEAAYQKDKDANVTVDDEREVDLTKMVQKRLDDHSKQRDVKREVETVVTHKRKSHPVFKSHSAKRQKTAP